MHNGKVGILVRTTRLWLLEGGRLAQVVDHELLLKGLVGGLGEQRLLLQDGQDAHGLLKHVDALLQVHAKVDHGPLDALAHVLLLLQHEHVVVEELLQLLVAEVDAHLLEAVVVKDLEAGNVQHADEGDTPHGGIDECLVALGHQIAEHALVDGPGYSGHGVIGLLNVLTLGHPFRANL